jgi:hypothetical protein
MSESAPMSGLLGKTGGRTQDKIAVRVDHYEDIQ